MIAEGQPVWMFGGRDALTNGLLNSVTKFNYNASTKSLSTFPATNNTNAPSTPMWPGSRTDFAIWQTDDDIFIFGGVGYGTQPNGSS